MPPEAAVNWLAHGGSSPELLSKMEEFFRELGKYNGKPYVHEALSIDELRRLFHDHGMDLLGPPLLGEWKVDEDGRVKHSA
jgi:hypothetical protein